MERIEAATAELVQQRPESSQERTLSVRQASPSDSQELVELMAQMAAHYPHQDIGPAAMSYQFDMQRLMERHGLLRVKTALLTLRIRPGQKFFPHPTEVAEELEAMTKTEQAQYKYQPDPECEHTRQRPALTPGWAWVTDKDGDRVIGRCACWRRWNGHMPAEDRKALAAGRD